MEAMWPSLSSSSCSVVCIRDRQLCNGKARQARADVSWACRSPHPPQEEGFKRVVMCSGKVYYELAKKRAELKKEKEVAIIRLEQVLLFVFVC